MPLEHHLPVHPLRLRRAAGLLCVCQEAINDVPPVVLHDGDPILSWIIHHGVGIPVILAWMKSSEERFAPIWPGEADPYSCHPSILLILHPDPNLPGAFPVLTLPLALDQTVAWGWRGG